MKQLCYYTVAKFIPDLIRNEPRNIGVLIFNENSNKYKSKFVNNIRSKVGKTMASDVQIIREYDNYFKTLMPNSKDEIVRSTSKSSGKIQFSEIKGVVTTDLENELDKLFSIFVGEEETVERKVKHRLKTNVKNELQELKLIGDDKIKINEGFDGGKSKVNHTVDFSYQNGILTVVEAVDFSIIDKKTNIFHSAFKFEDLLSGMGAKKVTPISVVQLSNDTSVDNEYIKILESVSTVYGYDDKSKKDFFSYMKRLVK